MADRVVHQFPPGEYTRVSLDHVRHQDVDRQRSLCYELVNRGLSNAGVVLCRMTRDDLEALREALDAELGRR